MHHISSPLPTYFMFWRYGAAVLSHYRASCADICSRNEFCYIILNPWLCGLSPTSYMYMGSHVSMVYICTYKQHFQWKLIFLPSKSHGVILNLLSFPEGQWPAVTSCLVGTSAIDIIHCAVNSKASIRYYPTLDVHEISRRQWFTEFSKDSGYKMLPKCFYVFLSHI